MSVHAIGSHFGQIVTKKLIEGESDSQAGLVYLSSASSWTVLTGLLDRIVSLQVIKRSIKNQPRGSTGLPMHSLTDRSLSGHIRRSLGVLSHCQPGLP